MQLGAFSISLAATARVRGGPLPGPAGMRVRALAMLVLALALVAPVGARVLRVEVASRTDVAGGEAFGDAGPFERVTGRVFFSVAVANPHNRGIVDLDRAENPANGEVEFSADVVIVRPKDPARGNGAMLLEIPNRGFGRIIGLVDGGTQDLADTGDAWLLRNGFTVATLGWQWDVAGEGALRLLAPVAREHGASITGLLRSDFVLSQRDVIDGDYVGSPRVDDIPLGHYFPRAPGGLGGIEYPVADTADARNVLTVRDRPESARTVVPRDRWRFARVPEGQPGLEPSDRFVHLADSFERGRIYEIVYVVRDPVVAGLGFAAVRDFASWAKHDSSALAPVRRVYGEGISQNGRFLRDMLYQGFNADEQGRAALDGVLAHVAGAGRGSFNLRFAQPSRDGQPMSAVQFPVDLFPFTDGTETDPATGERGGLLDRAAAEQVVPRIFLSQTSYEYWGRATSLIHTDADGRHDAAISDDVRIYTYSGLQHFSGPFPPAKGTDDLLGQQPQSPLPIRWFWRAMIANMDAWVRAGTPPPASRYPRIDQHALVPPAQYRFPAIPGVKRPATPVGAWHLDFGPKWREGVLSVQPPLVGEPFAVLVPQADADGNDLGGIRLPAVSVPLATYTGWNLRDPSIGAPDQCVSFLGSYLPFRRTAEERKMRGDPRPSIAERYRDRDDYLRRYGAAIRELVRQRYVLPEDAAKLLEHGGLEWDEATR
jgi:hypothetical protein